MSVVESSSRSQFLNLNSKISFQLHNNRSLLTAVVKIENSIIKPKTDIRILGIRIEMGSTYQKDSGKTDKTIQGTDKNFYLHMGRHLSKSPPDIHRRSSPGHNVWFYYMAHAKGYKKIERHLKQASRHTE